MHVAFSVWSWYVAAGQAEHDPVPAWPAGHAVQLCLFDETAQPSPDLHEVEWWLLLSCHFALGQLPHAMFELLEHAEVRFLPVPHEPQLLHVLALVSSEYVPLFPPLHALQAPLTRP